MKKKIILLGSNGFFGKNLINFFQKKFFIKKIYRGDSIKKINFKNYHFIINAAADVYNEKSMFQNNTELVSDILHKIIKENTRIRLIHFGSSGEYGAVNKKSKEDDLIVPRTVYEGTKAAATMLVQSYSKNFKIKSIIIRPFSIYGIHENKTRIMPNIFRHFLNNQKLNIYDGFHDYVYIDDLVLFINKLITDNRIKNYGEIVNFGSGKQFSNLEILNFCEELFKKKSKARYIPGFKKIYDKKIWCSNNSYLLKNFNFKLKYSIKNGIHDYIKKYMLNKTI
mgnify:FL=1